MEMRAVYAACLAELMEKDRHVVILDADLGKASGTLSLRKKFPEQSFDCGRGRPFQLRLQALD